MVNLPEIIVVNGIGVCLIGFLFMTMTQKKETRFITYKLFILMISITLVGCIVEVLSFLIDGKVFNGNIALSYIMNSFLFFGTVSIAHFAVERNFPRLFSHLRRESRFSPLQCPAFSV